MNTKHRALNRRLLEVAPCHRCLIAWFLMAIVWLLAGPASAAPSGRSKLATVVSNSDYVELGPLRNPAADGQLVASSLRAAGFKVTYLQNLRDEQFRAALRDIAKTSPHTDVSLFYYAGHAAQIGGVNYLLPVDVPKPEQEDDIRLASISADDVLSVMKSQYKVLVLDACRDNPVIGRALSRGRGASYKHGLAAIAPPADASGGVFIAYSTQTDAVAMDGEGTNSPFAESFAKYLGTAVSIDDMFAMVTKEVLRKTNSFQRPFKYASLDTVFCLTDECATAPSANTPGAGPQTSLAFSNSVQDAFAALNAAKATDVRQKIEEQLWQQLKKALPKQVAYGFAVTPEGKTVAYGFEPATAFGDTHHASATIRTAASKKPPFVIFSDTASTTYTLDCDAHTMAMTRVEVNGAVKLFSRAEQKDAAEKNPMQAGSVGESLEHALCSVPLRLTPLWGVDGLQWVSIGVGAPQPQQPNFSYALAPAISYRDPADDAIRYVLVRSVGDKPDALGAEMRYGWVALNCRTKQFRDAGYYGLTKKGVVVSVVGNGSDWTSPAKNSAIGNADILTCDQPQGDGP
jgi:uncharacterized caspase-like protein